MLKIFLPLVHLWMTTWVLLVNRAFLFDGAPHVVRSFQWQRKHSLIKISERAEKHGDVFLARHVCPFHVNGIFLYQAVFPE